jgi:hypothetical protein
LLEKYKWADLPMFERFSSTGLAAADDEPDREAPAPDRAGPRALSDHTTDA